MNYYINNVEKVKYKDYEINNEKNLLLFDNLNQIQELSQKLKMYYVISGSWALVLHTDTIYRTIQDIDIIIDIKNLQKWMTSLIDIYDFYYIGNPVEFFEYCINNYRLLPFIHKQNKMKLEISVVNDKHPWNKYQNFFYTKKINSNLYTYSLPLKTQKAEGFFYNRPRDIDDLDFYLPLINNKRDNL
jgi:hypothetical protein